MKVKDLINKGYTVYKEEKNNLVEIFTGIIIAGEYQPGLVFIAYSVI